MRVRIIVRVRFTPGRALISVLLGVEVLARGDDVPIL